MYKNIEILDKKKSKELKFDNVDTTKIAKNVGLIPLGFGEVWYASHSSVVIISSGEDAEFLAFTGISSEISIFNKSDVYLPAFIRSYPFLNVQVKDDKEQLNSVIAIDKNSDFVGENKAYNIKSVSSPNIIFQSIENKYKRSGQQRPCTLKNELRISCYHKKHVR